MTTSQSPSAGRPAPPAGWYPDPNGTGLRWWTGRAWAAQRTHGAGPVGPVTPSRPTRRRGLPWFRIAVLIIASSFAVVAVAKGQDIYRVGLDGRIEFYSRQGGAQVDGTDVRERQAEIDERVSRLEQTARERGQGQSSPEIVSIAGAWTGGSASYLIEQYGDVAVITEQSPYGITAYGVGRIAGTEFVFDYEVYDGSVGRGYLRLVDSSTLRGQFANHTYDATVEAQLNR